MRLLPPSDNGFNQRAFEYYGCLKRVRKYIEKNYDQRLSLGTVARIAEMERTYFSSFFHEKVGIPFRDWLRYVRVRKAMEMLSESNHPIIRVAHSVGFNEVRSFERAFKKSTQLTPLQFKKMVRPRVEAAM